MPEHLLRQMNLDEIIQGCRFEAGLPRGQETGYCLELFRRAVEEQEQMAWLAIDDQYKGLILRWLNNCSPELPRQEVEDIAPEAWRKFWQALTRSNVPLTDRFAHVGALLKYLKQCTLSVFYEQQRRQRRHEQVNQPLPPEEQAFSPCHESEEELLTRLDRETLLQAVQKWIDRCVTDPQEQRILSLSYEQGLTPVEIAADYPQEFPDAQTVRRLKERILKRARRALSEQEQFSPEENGQNGANRQNGKLLLEQVSLVSSKEVHHV
jgi:RNA polymerase sigma factor (sigma-70 family)